MPVFASAAVPIAYLDAGQGDPVLLIHGFASTKEVNWVETGWVETLVGAGRRVVAFDNRGHGGSGKRYAASDYRLAVMAGDAVGLLDHLGIPAADVIGYSMGGRIAATLAIEHGARIDRLVIGGIGAQLFTGMTDTPAIVAALEAPTLAAVDTDIGRTFRRFAESTGSDLSALAACIRAGRQPIDPDALGRIAAPTLIAVGTDDRVAGPPGPLAERIPGAEVLPIPRRDHMRAVGDTVFKAGVLEFLGRP
jgi:pimeloyl-ACP methyl ester carboxylesterase